MKAESPLVIDIYHQDLNNGDCRLTLHVDSEGSSRLHKAHTDLCHLFLQQHKIL